MKHPKSKFNFSSLLITIIVANMFLACGSGISNQKANADGFKVIENELQSKFGKNAYYTDLTITFNESIGNIIGVTVTEDPESLKMGQWNLTQDNWAQNSDITLEVPDGSIASDFMFQLNDKISLSKLGELVEKSCQQLKVDKNITHPMLNMAFVKFPKNGNLSKTEYAIMLQPENGGTTFSFRYDLAGKLLEMDF